MDNREIIAKRTHKTIYREGDACVKIFDETFSKSDILNEALNQARVEETGLLIPHIREVTVIDGCWAIISDYIEGPTLQQLMDENPDRLDEYLELFVDIQNEICSHTSPLLTQHKSKMNRKIDLTDFDAVTRYDLHRRVEGMPRHSMLLHGDFNPSNVIITKDGKHYVLDWSHATQGNREADAARTYLIFTLNGPEGLADKYLDIFTAKNGISRQDVTSWLPIVASTQSLKAIPGERDFLVDLVKADYL
ncbi:MAG: phosphotransferase [Erysipelotrichaceae bacterium]|nr:phosphotransferase [Erysipelotrichaceae bacterium]